MNNQYKFAPWLIVIAAMLWAVDAPFRKFLTQDLPSSSIVLLEHAVIFFFALPLLLRHRAQLKKLGSREWGSIIFIALGGSALATVFFTQSFRYVNPSVAILLHKTQPFIAILFAVLMLKEKLPRNFYLWALVGIFGAYLISFPELTIEGLRFAGGAKGVVFALLASFFWGGSTVFGRYVLRKVDFQLMTSLRFLTAFVFLIALSAVEGTLRETASASAKDLLYVGIIAILAGFISLFLYYRGLRFTRASIATIGELAFPFSAVVVNWIFLDAKLSLVQIAGGLILLIAISRLTLVNAKTQETQNRVPAEAIAPVPSG